MARILIGIDDTDNLESRGTGFRARQLGLQMQEKGLCKLHCISRHQLFVHEDIPFTSHNSSACIEVFSEEPISKLSEFGMEFLLRESAEGSDAGLCIAEWESISENVIEWGNNAKSIVLNKKGAHELAEKENIFLIGLTGEKIGVIGSLAAVGLRKGGNDGRVLWLENLREMKGTFNYEAFLSSIFIEEIIDKQGNPILKNTFINIGEWFRPVIKNKKITLILEEAQNGNINEWQIVSKDFIKSISQ